MIRVRQIVTEFNAPIVGDPDGRCEADAIRVGGDYTPGLCVIKKHGIPFNWDKQKGWGYSGAWLIFTGQDLNEFSTEFTVWRQDQIEAWKAWAKKYLTKQPAQPQRAGVFLPNVPRPQSLNIVHPLLAELGISACVPKHIGGWNQAAQGKWVKSIDWIQFRAPKPFLGKPKEPIPDTKGKPPVALDANQLEARAKRQQIEALQKAIALGHK